MMPVCRLLNTIMFPKKILNKCKVQIKSLIFGDTIEI